MSDTPVILLVDDDPNLRKTLSDILRLKGYEPLTASSGAAALDVVHHRKPAVALIDLRLEDIPGLDVMKRIKEISPETECIVVTGYASQASAIDAINVGAYSYLKKPYDMEQLLVTIRRAVEKCETIRGLRESEEIFRSTFDESPIGTAMVSLDFHFFRVNQALCHILGYSQDELTHLKFTEITHPDQVEIDKRHIQRLVAGKVNQYTTDKRYIRKDGNLVWAHVSVRLIRDQAGNPLYFLPLVEDISERKRAEEVIHLNEARLQALLDLNQEAITLSEKEIVNLGLKEGVRLTQSTIGYFHLVNEDQNTLQLYTWSEEVLKSCTAAYETHYPIEQAGIWADCARLKKPVIHNDYQALPDKKGYPEGHSHLVRHLSVPILEGEKVRLIIGVGNKTDEYDENDVRLLTLVADDVWKIIHRKRAEEVLHRRVTELEVLHENSLMMNSLLEPKEIGQKTIDVLAQRLNWHHAAVRLYHPANDSIELLAFNHPGLSKKKIQAEITRVQSLVSRADMGLSGWVIQHGEVVRSGDVNSDPRYFRTYPEIRSGLYVPIKTGTRTIGSISVESEEPNAFDAQDERLITSLAAQAAVSFENARLFAETHRRADELDLLYHAGLTFSEIIEPEDLGRQIVQTLERLKGWHRGSIWLLDETGNNLRMLFHNVSGLKGKKLQEELRRLQSLVTHTGQGIIGWVASHGEPVRTGNVRENPQYVEGDPKIQSELCVPLKLGARTTGVINIESYQPNAFDEIDERLLSTLAAQAAIAIENARLFAETRRRAEELGALARVSAALRTAQNRNEMLPVILEQVMALFKAEGAALAFQEVSTGEMFVELAQGALATLTHMHIPSGKGASGFVYQTAQPYVVPDIHKDENIYLPKNMPDVKAMAFIPLISQGKAIGVLEVGRKTAASESEVKLLVAIADIAANAIRRAVFHEQTNEYAEQMAAVNTLGRALAETLNLDQIYARLAQAALNLLPDTASIVISLYDPEAGVINAVHAIQDGMQIDNDSLAKMLPGPSVQSAQSEILRTAKPVIVGDPGEQDRDSEITLSPAGTPAGISPSALYVPMTVQSKVMGVVQVRSIKKNRYTQRDAELLNLVANTAAVAIENARLFDETQQRLRRLSTLHAIDAAIGASVDLRVTLNILLEHVTSELKADAAAVLLLHPHTMTLEYTVGRGFRAHIIEGVRSRMGEGLAGQAALQRHLIRIPDLSKSELVGKQFVSPATGSGGARSQSSDYFGGEGFAAYHAIPLIAKGQVQGVLEVFHRKPFESNQEWINFFEMLAGQAAVAIDNGRLFDGLQQSNLDLTLAYDATIRGWSRALELRDKETEGHTERVTELTLQLAHELGVNESEMEHIRRGALLHDIGKIAIPDNILLKPGPLSEQEWDLMRQHPVFAYNLLSSIDYLHPALTIPQHHHEKWNGSGYPAGLKGEDIPLEGRIFAVVDVYDALISDRPYRAAWPQEKAIEYIRTESGKHFDPNVVDTFLRVMATRD